MSDTAATAVAGTDLARRALRALADGRDDEALAILNSGSHAELAWCSAYLLSAVRESIAARFRKPAQVKWALHRAASGHEDPLLTQVAVILHEADTSD